MIGTTSTDAFATPAAAVLAEPAVQYATDSAFRTGHHLQPAGAPDVALSHVADAPYLGVGGAARITVAAGATAQQNVRVLALDAAALTAALNAAIAAGEPAWIYAAVSARWGDAARAYYEAENEYWALQVKVVHDGGQVTARTGVFSVHQTADVGGWHRYRFLEGVPDAVGTVEDVQVVVVPTFGFAAPGPAAPVVLDLTHLTVALDPPGRDLCSLVNDGPTARSYGPGLVYVGQPADRADPAQWVELAASVTQYATDTDHAGGLGAAKAGAPDTALAWERQDGAGPGEGDSVRATVAAGTTAQQLVQLTGLDAAALAAALAAGREVYLRAWMRGDAAAVAWAADNGGRTPTVRLLVTHDGGAQTYLDLVPAVSGGWAETAARVAVPDTVGSVEAVALYVRLNPVLPSATAAAMTWWLDRLTVALDAPAAGVPPLVNHGSSAVAYAPMLHAPRGVELPALYVSGQQVVGPRQPAIPDDASGAPNQATVNAIVALLRDHGLCDR